MPYKDTTRAKECARRSYYKGRNDPVRGPQLKRLSVKKAAEWAAKNQDKYRLYKRRRSVRRHTGLTVADYEFRLASQGHQCAICLTPFEIARPRTFGLDHCHESGRIREFLCGRCNRGLGFFGDDTSRLFRACQYLVKHGKPTWTAAS